MSGPAAADPTMPRVVPTVGLWVLLLGGLYGLSAFDYLLFHSIAEIFAIVIEFTIFITVWNGRRFLTGHYLLFVGCAYAAVAAIDVVHTLAYRGMGVFAGSDTDLATQLWIAGGYLGSTAIAVAPLYLRRRASPHLLLFAFLSAAAILIAAIFTGRFPRCFIEGHGLTPFKVISEYVIALLFATGAVLLVLRRHEIGKAVLRLLVAAIGLRIAAELAFTAYATAFATANMVGHLLRIVSSYLLYKAILESAFLRPYEILFRDLKQREGELEATVKELEAFSYSVSHDLRAPLSAISGFAELLQRDYSASLDDEATHYLARIHSAAKRMNELIDDLLKLSRLARQPMSIGAVDVSAIASSVAAELHDRDPERHVKVVVAPGITCTGDERLLRVVLENLIGNAWKFTAKTDEARITVVGDPEGGFIISDNGAGFDPKYASKLFSPFQRLHSATDFPGTGIGLATVKRIVSRHGGEVSADGAPNQGATVRVRLPSEAEDPSSAPRL